ncbi:unnamed protein product [Cylindrotheca closterium]|uniref:Helicase-associated domain-containing protein n=1 Tax=Cylindrotheca closterium TaxID=2856 RepID=A0AAD2GBD4_9STRA|nr:unnamed protein product [Cylindrotheca closterium]
MSTAAFSNDFSPITSLNKTAVERKRETGEEIVPESKERDGQPKDLQQSKVGQQGSNNRPNKPNAYPEAEIMNQSLNAERVSETTGPTANVHRTQGATDRAEAFFAYQQSPLRGMNSTARPQPRPFPMTLPTSSTAQYETHQRHVPITRGVAAFVPGYWLGSTYLPFDRCSQAPGTSGPLPFPTASTSAFQSYGPLQAHTVAPTKPPHASVPSPNWPYPSGPMAISLSSDAAPVQAPTKPLASAAKSPQRPALSVEQFRGIQYSAIQVSTKTEACEWLAKFEQFVLSRETKVKKGTVRNLGPIRHWSRTQRKIYLRDSLHPGRYNLLAKYGVFDIAKLRPFKETQTQRTKWMHQYEKLKKFRLAKGHFNVPWNEDKTLLQWIKSQRERYVGWKNGVSQMPVYRVRKLEAIGFEWRRKT